jgi:phosphatidylserine/phosphatidylglycerophosphate/cardiolipin synthase-like enzyme
MDFIRILSKKKAYVNIFTRPPRKKEETSVLLKLKKEAKAQIFVSRNLHAKIYVIESKKEKYVILTSANFTNEARGNIEIGLLVLNNDIFMKRVIYSLLSYLRPECRRWR